jgi:hypothetical protein
MCIYTFLHAELHTCKVMLKLRLRNAVQERRFFDDLCSACGCKIPGKSKFQSAETLSCLMWVRDKSQSQSLHSKIVPRISSNLSIRKNDINLRVRRRTTLRSVVDNPQLDASRGFLRLQTFRSLVLKNKIKGGANHFVRARHSPPRGKSQVC